jgi:hypothetical protein
MIGAVACGHEDLVNFRVACAPRLELTHKKARRRTDGPF